MIGEQRARKGLSAETAGTVRPDPATAAERVTLVAVASVDEDGVGAFQRYESAVLPLLSRHGGRLDRRLRTADGWTEVHLVSFDSRAGYEAYLADPMRLAHRALLTGVDVEQWSVEVHDVNPTRR